MGTEQKQKQIYRMLDGLGWSTKTLADVLYEELYCGEHENFDTDYDAINKFHQKLKKQLKRTSTKEGTLDQFIKIISEHPSFIDLKWDYVVPKYVKHQCLSNELFAGLADISNQLDES